MRHLCHRQWILTDEYRTAAGRPVAKVTALNYYRGLCSALNAAVRDGAITDKSRDADSSTCLRAPTATGSSSSGP